MAHSLFNQDIQLLRDASEGCWTVDHEYIEGAETVVNVKGSIQPYREGKDTQRIEAGFQTRDVIKVYSDGAIRSYDEKAGIIADEVVYNGNRYVCKDFQDWSAIGFLPHWLGIFYKKDLS